jgi:hypothetical protein
MQTLRKENNGQKSLIMYMLKAVQGTVRTHIQSTLDVRFGVVSHHVDLVERDDVRPKGRFKNLSVMLAEGFQSKHVRFRAGFSVGHVRERLVR